MRIDEPQSCEYIIVVATKKICSIPQFRPHELQKPKEIKCSPGKLLFLKQVRTGKNAFEIEKLLK